MKLDPCAQPLNNGSNKCNESQKRWYHNHSSGDCEEFTYSGCDGNQNNFESKGACDTECAKWHEEHKDHHHQHGHEHHSQHQHHH